MAVLVSRSRTELYNVDGKTLKHLSHLLMKHWWHLIISSFLQSAISPVTSAQDHKPFVTNLNNLGFARAADDDSSWLIVLIIYIYIYANHGLDLFITLHLETVTGDSVSVTTGLMTKSLFKLSMSLLWSYGWVVVMWTSSPIWKMLSTCPLFIIPNGWPGHYHNFTTITTLKGVVLDFTLPIQP